MIDFYSDPSFTSDTLLQSDLNPSASDRARQLSRIARTQQERLWALTEEVRTEVAAGRIQQRQQQEEVSA